MEPWTTSKVHDLLAEAIRNYDHATVMRIVTEQINSTEGAEKAYWLRYRAAAKRVYGQSGHQTTIEADLAEAVKACPEDESLVVNEALDLALREQRASHLTKLPWRLRHAVRKKMYGDWRFWSNMGFLHRLRRRFDRSYRAYSRTLELYLAISEDERRNNGGWAIPVYCWRARAAVRIGRTAEAAADVARATEIDGERVRRHLYPLHLAVTQAEVAVAEGRYRAAIELLQVGRSRTAAGQFHVHPLDQIDCDLIAARVARAEGNLTGFRHFCGRALAAAVDNQLPLTAETVRAVMNGAMW